MRRGVLLSLALAPTAGCLDVGDVESAGGGGAGTGGSVVADGSWQGGGGGGGYPGPPPELLPNGRTHDQELAYIKWSGAVSLVTIVHKDETKLPAEEGGASCASGCTEQVTRIEDGGSVWGRFAALTAFSVQLAHVTDSAAGLAVVSACGVTAGSWPLNLPGSGTPGFSNFPSPAWAPPTSGECMWEIRAEGGYAFFRAVTVIQSP